MDDLEAGSADDLGMGREIIRLAAKIYPSRLQSLIPNQADTSEPGLRIRLFSKFGSGPVFFAGSGFFTRSLGSDF